MLHVHRLSSGLVTARRSEASKATARRSEASKATARRSEASKASANWGRCLTALLSVRRSIRKCFDMRTTSQRYCYLAL